MTVVNPMEMEAVGAFRGVQRALSELVSALPGEMRRATDLQKALEVDYKICWQVFNVIQATDFLAASKHAPSGPGSKRFLAAAERLGVSEEIVGAVREALEEFASMVSRHAVDRNDFNSMLAAVVGDETAPAAELQHRRGSYKHLSHIWGMQIDMHATTAMVRASVSGAGTDECILTMKRGIRVLRPGVSPMVQGYRHHASGQKVVGGHQPIDAVSAGRYGAPLLPEFCSKPMPELKTVEKSGWVCYELAKPMIGRSQSADFAFGGIGRDVPYSKDVDGRRIFRMSIQSRIPVETGFIHLLVHRPSFGSVVPEGMMFLGMPGDDSPAAAREAPQLSLLSEPQVLGSADRIASTPELPRYRELLKYAAEQLGWDLGEFDAFRLRVAYPVFGASFRLQCYLS